MAFIKHTNTRGRIGTPKISIWERGQLGFNQAAALKYDIASYKYAILYFDPDEQKIGIRLTNDGDEEGAIKLFIRKGSGASFSAVSFLRTYDIAFGKKTEKYNFEFMKDINMFVFEPKIVK